MHSRDLSPELVSLIQHVELSSAGWRQSALQQIIIACLWLSTRPLTTEEVRKELVDSFSVPVLPIRVRSELNNLSTVGSVVPTDDDSWKLSEAGRSRCDSQLAEAEAVSKGAFERFEVVLEQSCPTLPPRETWEKFNAEFLSPLVKAIGARTYELLTGAGAGSRWMSVLGEFAREFPGVLRDDLKRAASYFLDPRDAKVRDYVLRYLNAHFYLEALRMSESVLEKIIGHDKPTFLIFLDSNFIFSMLKLHENPANEAAESLKILLADPPSSIAATMYVTPTTVEEIKRVLTAAQGTLLHLRLHENLAKAALGAELSGMAIRFIEENFRARKALDAKTYFAPYLSNLIGCLRQQGVEVFNERMESWKTSQAVLDDVRSELEYEKEHHPSNPKSYKRLEHDMVLWHFVKDKRPAIVESPVQATHWVVTIDYRFLDFDNRKREDKAVSVPVCLYPTNLIQMLQFWVPRSEDLDRALLGSMRLPFLFKAFDEHAERVTLKILSVLGRFEDAPDFPSDTVKAVMVNKGLRERIADETNPEQDLQLVQDAIAEENARILGELLDLKERIPQMEKELSTAREETSAHDNLLRQKDNVLRAKEAEIGSLRAEKDSLESRVTALETAEVAHKAYTMFFWQWFALPLLALGGFTWLGGYLLARFALVEHWLGSVTLSCFSLMLWAFLAGGRISCSPQLKTTRLARFVLTFRRALSMIILGIVGSVLGGLLIAQVLK